jgi:hypothetical protein
MIIRNIPIDTTYCTLVYHTTKSNGIMTLYHFLTLTSDAALQTQIIKGEAFHNKKQN